MEIAWRSRTNAANKASRTLHSKPAQQVLLVGVSEMRRQIDKGNRMKALCSRPSAEPRSRKCRQKNLRVIY